MKRDRMSEVTKQFHCSFGGKMLLNRTNSTELVTLAGFRVLTNEVVQGQCAVEFIHSFHSILCPQMLKSIIIWDNLQYSLLFSCQ